MIRRFFRLLILFLSAGLLGLPFHFGNLYGLAFIALVPLFFLIKNRPGRDAFKLSYIFGCFFFALLGYWLNYVNVLGFVLMVLYLGLYFGVFGYLASYFLHAANDFDRNDVRKNIKAALFIPAFWVVLEYVRGFMISGLPWALMAYSQWKNVTFIQIADITGAYGVSYLVLLVNVLIFKALDIARDRKKASEKAPGYRTHQTKLLMSYGILLTVALLSVTLYGSAALKSRDNWYKKDTIKKSQLRVSVVQGNIPQELKWDSKIKNIIFEKYKRLTFMSSVERSDLIVWPETSFPGYLEDEPLLAAQLRSMVRQTKTDVLIGAPTLGDLDLGLKFYNSAILFGPDGEEIKRYSKVHLVPFGEYVPLDAILGFIRHFFAIGHFSAGNEKTIFQIQSRYQEPNIKARFGVLICYEDIFPGLVRDFCRNGADFLINMTNDAWFGKTSAPYQHAQASLFRAVENRVNVVRATNTGLSCFISPEGRILAAVEDNGKEIFVTGRRSHDIFLRKTPTFYTRFGDVFVFVMLFLCFLAYREKTKHQPYSRL